MNLLLTSVRYRFRLVYVIHSNLIHLPVGQGGVIQPT